MEGERNLVLGLWPNITDGGNIAILSDLRLFKVIGVPVVNQPQMWSEPEGKTKQTEVGILGSESQ